MTQLLVVLYLRAADRSRFASWPNVCDGGMCALRWLSGALISNRTERGIVMLWTVTAVLVVLWLLGVVGVYTVGTWIHVLLVLAVASAIFSLIQGRGAV